MSDEDRLEQGGADAWDGPKDGGFGPEGGGPEETPGGPDESGNVEDAPHSGGTPAGAEAAGVPEARPKANTLNRVIARFMDILFALLLLRLPGYVGFLAGLTYIGIADGLMDGRSLGKRIIGLRTLNAERGTPADFRDSILRNSTVAVYYALFQIPVLGWALAFFGLGFELLLVIGSAEGRRLGDEIAGTVVVDQARVSE